MDIIDVALREDGYANDLTSRFFIPSNQTCQAYILVKEDAVICGIDVARKIFLKIDKNLSVKPTTIDGKRIKKGSKVLLIKGKARSILAGERIALNFLGHLSGISTQTRVFVDAVKGTKAKILDTRKTTPGLRELERLAVRCGGGVNHRFNLSDMALVKDNHRMNFANLTHLAEAICRYKKSSSRKIEVEVDHLSEFFAVIKAKPDIILLDNMRLSDMKRAVQFTKSLSPNDRPLLEASGGITLKNVRKVAQTGVDRISIGALTHSVRNIDFSLEID